MADSRCMTDRLQELESIAEGIEDVHAIESHERFVRHRRKPGVPAPRCEFGEPAHEDCRVRFASRMEVAVDSVTDECIPMMLTDCFSRDLFPRLDEKGAEYMARLNLSQRPIISPS